jgi:hypothetical protein
MTLDYIINYTDDSIKPPFLIPFGNIDVSSTSLKLYGKGANGYGEGLQENLISLLENFCSGTAPANPTPGQLWYNTIDYKLYIYTPSLQWESINTNTAVSNSPPANPILGQSWYNSVDNTMYIFDGSNWISTNAGLAITGPNQLMGSSGDGLSVEYKSINSSNNTININHYPGGIDLTNIVPPVSDGTNNQLLGLNSVADAIEYKSIQSSDNSVTIDFNANIIDISVNVVDGGTF